jgi:predicted alpha/beta superfamily hydrolase
MKRCVCLLALSLAACGGPASPVRGDGGVDLAHEVSDGDLPDGAPDGTTTLRVHYPAGAHTLSVRGDTLPMSWTTGLSMTAGADDTWTYSVVLPATVTQIQWKPLADDSTWSRGPNYTAQRGQTVDVYPHFFTVTGTVSQLFPAFQSTLLGNTRVVWMYLPPSYNENTRETFPVLYMHDGQNLFNVQPTLGTNGWQADATLDAAAEDGSIADLIIIAPENAGTQREYEYTPTYDPSEMAGGGGDLYLGMLVTELKPQVDEMLRTQAGRDSTGTLGSSLGGLISAYAGVTKASTYGIIGAMSPSTWWDNEVIVTDVKGMGALRPNKVYVDCGTAADDGDGQVETADLFAAYQAIGYVQGTTYDQVIQPGGAHSEMYWAERLPGALAYLFGPRAYLPPPTP